MKIELPNSKNCSRNKKEGDIFENAKEAESQERMSGGRNSMGGSLEASEAKQILDEVSTGGMFSPIATNQAENSPELSKDDEIIPPAESNNKEWQDTIEELMSPEENKMKCTYNQVEVLGKGKYFGDIEEINSVKESKDVNDHFETKNSNVVTEQPIVIKNAHIPAKQEGEIKENEVVVEAKEEDVIKTANESISAIETAVVKDAPIVKGEAAKTNEIITVVEQPLAGEYASNVYWKSSFSYDISDSATDFC